MVITLLVVCFAALASLLVWHFRAKIERIGKKPAATANDGVIQFPQTGTGY